MVQSHAQGIDKNADHKELEAHFQHVFRNEEEIVLSGVHERVRIQMRGPMGHNGNPGTDVDKYRVQRRVNHPGHHGVPVHFSFVHKENIIYGHQNGDEIMENIVIEREMFITDVVEPVGFNRPRPNDPMIHERQRTQTGRHDIATIGGIQERNIHPQQRRPEPEHK